MLDPHDRHLLLESLRPPDGYELDFAIGTTFSLDLLALLTAPLGFTLFEMAEDPARAVSHEGSLILLQTLRRYASRIAIFCDAGRIVVPRGEKLLYTKLEKSVVPVAARNPRGVFHPKVWVIRYVPGDAAPVRYRFLCLSRNLTFDRSWDTILVMDGELTSRKRAFAANHPLGDFVRALPELAVRRPVAQTVLDRIETAQTELRRVAFESPPGFGDFQFWPIGHDGRHEWPFEERIDRLLVVSPFLDAAALRRLGQEGKRNILISRADSLQAMSGEELAPFESVYSLMPEAAPAQEEDESLGCDPAVGTPSLHAKLYVADAGWDAAIWTGSANATTAAFERNVEFLVELDGPKSAFGIDRLLRASDDGTVAFRSLLHEFEPLAEPVCPDPKLREAEDELEIVRRAISRVPWTARVRPLESGEMFSLAFAPEAAVAVHRTDARIRCWPIGVDESAAQVWPPEKGTELLWAPVTVQALTSFFAFDVTLPGMGLECRFVINANLEGAPADRDECVLRHLLRDRSQVVRFLLLLLGDEFGAGVGGEGWTPGWYGGGSDRGVTESTALLEPLLRALDREPSRLQDVARLLRDLSATAEGRSIIPERLEEVLASIIEAGGTRRS